MLLLDEEDDVVVVDCSPPMKLARTETASPAPPHASTAQAETDTTPVTVVAPRHNTERVADVSRSAPTSTSPLPPAAVVDATSHDVSEAKFYVKGGDGMDKIAALAYGAPRVQVVYSPSPTSPTARSRRPRASGDGGEGSVATRRECTQPMAVSAATTSGTRSSTDNPDLSREGASGYTSRSQGVLEGVVDVDASSQSARAIGTPLPPVSRSLRSDLNDDDSAASTGVTQKTVSIPTTPPKQMNLVDFFAKMKCKASQ